MKHLLKMSPILVLMGFSTLGAATITTDFGGTACLPQGICSAQPGAITVDFNDGLLATGPYTAGIATYVWGSQLSSPIVQGSHDGAYAAPGQGLDQSPYLSVGSPGGPSTVTINLSSPINYFGFYFGSPDAYNSIRFYSGGALVRTFFGDSSDLKPQSAALGNWDTANYVNFRVSGGTVDKIVLESTSAAFETDNHAFATATPEPSTVLTLGIGGILIVAGRMRIQRRTRSN